MDRLNDDFVLDLIRVGADNVNFKILKLLGINIKNNIKIEDVMKEIGLTKVPVNVRINKLENVGLVKRWRGTGLVILTDIGIIFYNEIKRFMEDIVAKKL